MQTFRWILIAVLAVCLSGCFAFRQPQQAGTSPDSAGQWVCTGSHENGDWSCRKVTEDETTSAIDRATQVAGAPRDTSQVQSQNLQPNQVRVHRYDPATPQQYASTNNEQYSSPPARDTSADPEYLRLSYQPDTPTRIVDLPDRFFAVQLVAFQDIDKANKYAEDNDDWLVEPRGARIAAGSKVMYVVLLGIYETRSLAERAANSVSREVGSSKPWVRSMTSLKTAIKSADTATASGRL